MENQNNICSICHENIDGIINLMTTECNHKFHSTCYIKYVKTSDKWSCPICRNNFGISDDYDEEDDEEDYIESEPVRMIIVEDVSEELKQYYVHRFFGILFLMQKPELLKAYCSLLPQKYYEYLFGIIPYRYMERYVIPKQLRKITIEYIKNKVCPEDEVFFERNLHFLY
jgi:hypothetical protein